MSVVVRMKMPKEGCHTCDARCVSALYGYICGIERKNVMPFLGKKNRPDWCPILCSLPEGHGRLVDKDLLMQDLDFLNTFDTPDDGKELSYEDIWVTIDDFPTIVPAERR